MSDAFCKRPLKSTSGFQSPPVCEALMGQDITMPRVSMLYCTVCLASRDAPTDKPSCGSGTIQRLEVKLNAMTG
eukprot:4682-Amphidinium_carterae.1